MRENQKIMRRALDKKMESFRNVLPFEIPSQGWIRTVREALGMTTAQLARRAGVSQARIVYLEKNENNLKVSTLNKIAGALNCAFVYCLIPESRIESIVEKQAQKKALELMQKTNRNMAMEDQLSDIDETLGDLTNKLLDKNISRIWDDK
ncbi:MAG: mobile mystery protein A [Elusimicrobiota bacterium]|jgi:predicted DNA-binding mobile mystery protein A|nr:mobile mystery protein A [Elusimicrobiota bacterium]